MAVCFDELMNLPLPASTAVPSSHPFSIAVAPAPQKQTFAYVDLPQSAKLHPANPEAVHSRSRLVL